MSGEKEKISGSQDNKRFPQDLTTIYHNVAMVG
jgi:hypothetical protein